MNRNSIAGVLASGCAALLLSASPALADDREVEGDIQAIDAGARSVTVAGDEYFADARTDYDDDYDSFEDLRVGDRVEIDYRVIDGRRVIEEIERDD